MKNEIIIITPAQIEDCDLGIAQIFDPQKFTKTELRSLCGALRLRFQNTSGPDDVFLQPASRRFVQSLHKIWPWAGFFLHCEPIHSGATNQEITDVGVLVAWVFCHTSDLTLVKNTNGVGMRFDREQFDTALLDISNRAHELCFVAGMTKQAALLRRRQVLRSIQSFFDLGEMQTMNALK